MEKLITDLQLLDNYVSKCNIDIFNKISHSAEMNIDVNVGFCIVNIDEENSIGQIELTYDIDARVKDKKAATISLVMNALFHTSNNLDKKDFEKLLKYNAAPILSNLCIVYISSITALSGISAINLPIIDFNDFFSNTTTEKL